MEATSKKDARSMRWHPLMIRWCIGSNYRYILLSRENVHSYIHECTVGPVVLMLE